MILTVAICNLQLINSKWLNSHDDNRKKEGFRTIKE